jgi:hypothetical protein
MRGLGLTNRQLGELYACYRAAGPAARRKIVEDPALFLKARAAAAAGAVESALDERQQRCVKNLELVGNVSLGLARSLPEALNYDTPALARRRLEGAWSSCRERFGLLAKCVGELLKEAGHARQGDADGDIDASREGPGPAGDRAGAQDQPHQRACGAA